MAPLRSTLFLQFREIEVFIEQPLSTEWKLSGYRKTRRGKTGLRQNFVLCISVPVGTNPCTTKSPPLGQILLPMLDTFIESSDSLAKTADCFF